MISIINSSRPRLAVPELQPEQMRAIGDFARVQEVDRIAQGLNIADAPAKRLSRGYAIGKKRAGHAGIRDLHFTGALLDARRVIDAETDEVIVGFDDGRQVAKALRNEQIEPMLGISPGSIAEITNFVQEEFKESVKASQ